MRLVKPNPMNGHRRELLEAEAPLLAPDADARQSPAFRLQVRRSVLMHPVLAATVAGISFVLLVAFALVRKPVYTAESLIYVEPLEVRVLSDGSSSGYDPSRYDSYLQQQVQTVERPDTLEAALTKLPAGMWGAPGDSAAVAARQLEGALKVERVLNSYQLAIDVTAANPNIAAETANAITSAYLEEGRKDEHARADQRLQLLTEERQRITEDMTRDKTEQASLGKSLGVANPNGASGNPYDVQSEGLRSLLASARQARDAVSAQLSSISGGNGGGLDTAANELIASDPELVSMRQTLAQRRAVLADQMAGLTPANPIYKQDQEEIAALDRSVERATGDARQRAERQLQDKLRLDLRRTADVEGRINAQLAEQTAKATGAGPKLQRASELETDLQRLSTRYAAVDDAIRGLQLETGGPGQAHLVLAARVPRAPQPSRARLLLWLALPLALLFGVVAAAIAHRMDQRLYIAGDLQEVLGFTPMCVLPNPSEVSPAAYDEFVLRLAGGLEGAYRHGRARSFVFTPVSVSARPVRLLPQLCARLGQIGVRAAYITAEELMSAASHRSEPPKRDSRHELEVARGRHDVPATSLERFLVEYDLVLIQAPALLGSALTEYAVRCADATILLVDSTLTTRTDLRRAAMLLERLNPQGVATVLEDMPLRYADSVFLAAVRTATRVPGKDAVRVSKVAVREQTAAEPVAAGAQNAAVLPAETRDFAAVDEENEPFAESETPFTPTYVVEDDAESDKQNETWSEYEETIAQEYTPAQVEPSTNGGDLHSAAYSEPPSEQASADGDETPIRLEQDLEPAEQMQVTEGWSSPPSDMAETFLSEQAVPHDAYDVVAQEPEEAETPVQPAAMAGEEEVSAHVLPSRETNEPADIQRLPEWPPTVEPVRQVETEASTAPAEHDSAPGPVQNAERMEPSAMNLADMASKPAKWLRRLVRLSEDTMPTIRTDEDADITAKRDAAQAETLTAPKQDVERLMHVSEASAVAAEAPKTLGMQTPGMQEIVFREDMAPVYTSYPAVPAAQVHDTLVAEPAQLTVDTEAAFLAAEAGDEPLPERDEEPAPLATAVEEPVVEDLYEVQEAPSATFVSEPPVAAPEVFPEVPTSEVAAEWHVEAGWDQPEPAASLASESYREAVELEPYAAASFSDEEEPAPAFIESQPLPEFVVEDPAVEDFHAEQEPHFEPIAPEFPEPELVTAAAEIPSDFRAEEQELPAAEVLVEEATVEPEAAVYEPSPASETKPVQPAAAEEREAEWPVVSFSRYAEAPVTVAAIPSLMSSVANARRARLDANGAEPSAALDGHDGQQAPVSDEVWRGSPLPPQRRLGLVRALTQAATEAGPPARASEGLAAMRRGSGLQKALARQEASLRTPVADTPHEQPPVRRQWAMLSRFGHSGGAAVLERDEAESASNAADKNGAADHARDTDV